MKSSLQIRDEHDLVDVAAKNPDLYPTVPLTSLTAYSLYSLHQWQLRRTIEAIAVLNWRLFPDNAVNLARKLGWYNSGTVWRSIEFSTV